MENYSRHLTGRHKGDAPDTLVDFLSANSEWLLIVDESHVTLPQIGGMSAADKVRKQSLVRHGFRLPSSLDNRPLTDDEFWRKVSNAVFVSATPGDREMLLAASAFPAFVSSASPVISAPSSAAAAARGGGEGDKEDVGEGVAPPGVVDMTIRPTNVLDPEIEIHPREGQLPTLLQAQLFRSKPYRDFTD